MTDSLTSNWRRKKKLEIKLWIHPARFCVQASGDPNTQAQTVTARLRSRTTRPDAPEQKNEYGRECVLVLICQWGIWGWNNDISITLLTVGDGCSGLALRAEWLANNSMQAREWTTDRDALWTWIRAWIRPCCQDAAARCLAASESAAEELENWGFQVTTKLKMRHLRRAKSHELFRARSRSKSAAKC